MIKSRDFVNLRCWHLCRDGNIIDVDDSSAEETGSVTVVLTSPKDDTDDECILGKGVQQSMQKSLSDARINESKQRNVPEMGTLSKSLGARGFFDDDFNSGDEKFEDAENDDKSSVGSVSILKPSGKVYVSAAISVPYNSVPPSTQFTRFDWEEHCGFCLLTLIFFCISGVKIYCHVGLCVKWMEMLTHVYSSGYCA